MTVYLVGAGPGDPGLMTARALELIATADVIIHDRLIASSVLEGAREDAELLYAGKEGGGPSVSQDDIDRLLLEHGAAGREVVRLKGGDPFVFGRGGEEAQALREAGIAFEVVPGITAGVAAPAYAGIPVTHRDAARTRRPGKARVSPGLELAGRVSGHAGRVHGHAAARGDHQPTDRRRTGPLGARSGHRAGNAAGPAGGARHAGVDRIGRRRPGHQGAGDRAVRRGGGVARPAGLA